MSDFLSLHDAEQIQAEAEAEAIPGPGLRAIVLGVIARPAETLRDALAHPVQSVALTLAAAGGVYWAVNFAIAQGAGASLPLPALLGMLMVLGVLGGVAYLYSLSILLNWSCDVLNGRPTRAKIRMLLAVAGIPGVIALVLFGIPRIALFGQGLFQGDRPWMSASPILVWGLWFGDAVMFTWSLMIVVRGIKIMNGFTTLRAVAAAAMPVLPIILIGLLFLAIAWTGVFFAPPAF